MDKAALQTHSLPVTRTVVGEAPAKVNLLLNVHGRLPDGFHEIHSLAIGVGLFDRITASLPNTAGLTLECTDPTLRSDENLVIRAALALARHSGCDAEAVLRLQKGIPVGAGLGGGSSDAATTLRICKGLWNAKSPDAALEALGAELGSDVALFFHLPAVAISGRGEKVAPVAMGWSGCVLLIFPGIHVSTREVYSAWKPEDSGRRDKARIPDFCGCRRARDLRDLCSNELEPALFRVCPGVKEAVRLLNSLGLPAVRVTGSGSALFCLFDERDEAVRAARRIEESAAAMNTAVVDAPVGIVPLESKES